MAARRCEDARNPHRLALPESNCGVARVGCLNRAAPHMADDSSDGKPKGYEPSLALSSISGRNRDLGPGRTRAIAAAVASPAAGRPSTTFMKAGRRPRDRRARAVSVIA